LNEWKTDLWNIAGIPSPADDRETNDAILLGYAVIWFIGEVSATNNNNVLCLFGT
jgi:glycogen(starch) synthase